VAAYCLHFAYYNFAGFTARCALHPQWKRASRITCGKLANCRRGIR